MLLEDSNVDKNDSKHDIPKVETQTKNHMVLKKIQRTVKRLRFLINQLSKLFRGKRCTDGGVPKHILMLQKNKAKSIYTDYTGLY